MVVYRQRQNARQLSLGFSPIKAAQAPPQKAEIPKAAQNSAKLKIEICEFLLSKSNSAFNSLLSLLEKARPEAAGCLRAELCRIFCARMEGNKAILGKIPSKSQIEEAHALLRGLETYRANFRKSSGKDDWKWKFVSEEEQNGRYALDSYSSLCLLSALNSLFEKREYSDFIMVLDLSEKQARESAAKREYGKPRVSKYEQYICHELQLGISGKVKELAQLEEKN